jgi:hypothetical protein
MGHSRNVPARLCASSQSGELSGGLAALRPRKLLMLRCYYPTFFSHISG